ncbi:hypothetical protein GQ42DRAFT_9801 [Ramicandelaber brevisporus]|nr:hypothetical protein GQ42DRAFT_9801 [Ramicandelaber brevisporus]
MKALILFLFALPLLCTLVSGKDCTTKYYINYDRRELEVPLGSCKYDCEKDAHYIGKEVKCDDGKCVIDGDSSSNSMTTCINIGNYCKQKKGIWYLHGFNLLYCGKKLSDTIYVNYQTPANGRFPAELKTCEINHPYKKGFKSFIVESEKDAGFVCKDDLSKRDNRLKCEIATDQKTHDMCDDIDTRCKEYKGKAKDGDGKNWCSPAQIPTPPPNVHPPTTVRHIDYNGGGFEYIDCDLKSETSVTEIINDNPGWDCRVYKAGNLLYLWAVGCLSKANTRVECSELRKSCEHFGGSSSTQRSYKCDPRFVDYSKLCCYKLWWDTASSGYKRISHGACSCPNCKTCDCDKGC